MEVSPCCMKIEKISHCHFRLKIVEATLFDFAANLKPCGSALTDALVLRADKQTLIAVGEIGPIHKVNRKYVCLLTQSIRLKSTTSDDLLQRAGSRSRQRICWP